MFYQVTDSFGSFFAVLTFKQALSKLQVCSPQAQVKRLDLISGKWDVIAQRTQGLQGNNQFKVTGSSELIKTTEAYRASRRFFRSNPDQGAMASSKRLFERLLKAIPIQAATCKQVCLYQAGNGCSKGLTQGKGSTCVKS